MWKVTVTDTRTGKVIRERLYKERWAAMQYTKSVGNQQEMVVTKVKTDIK